MLQQCILNQNATPFRWSRSDWLSWIIVLLSFLLRLWRSSSRIFSFKFIKYFFITLRLYLQELTSPTTAGRVASCRGSDGFNAEQKYMASCFACHSTGAAGAPKVGDGFAAEWTPRMEKGMDAVVINAINGINTMPPKGLCFDCNNDDLRAVV